MTESEDNQEYYLVNWYDTSSKMQQSYIKLCKQKLSADERIGLIHKPTRKSQIHQNKALRIRRLMKAEHASTLHYKWRKAETLWMHLRRRCNVTKQIKQGLDASKLLSRTRNKSFNDMLTMMPSSSTPFTTNLSTNWGQDVGVWSVPLATMIRQRNVTAL